jgi:hypothetical protein
MLGVFKGILSENIVMIAHTEIMIISLLLLQFVIAFGFLSFMIRSLNSKIHYYIENPEELTKKNTFWEIFCVVMQLTIWLWLLYMAISHV